MATATADATRTRFGEVVGAFALIFAGALDPVFLVFSRVLQSAQWPYYQFNGIVFVAIGVILFLYRAARGTLSKRLLIWKWLFLRGAFGGGQYVCGVIAAPLAPIGDLVALGTINIVVAAMVGQLFLKERLRPQQVLAFLCCIAGAILITRPSFIFGGAEVQSSAIVGYCVVVAGSFSRAGAVISSRRLSEAPVSELVGAALFASGMILIALPFFDNFSEPSWEPVLESPLIAVGVMLGLGLLGFAGSFLFTMGSKQLPAAVSSTLNNAANLTFGYISQWVFFNMAPDKEAAGGAALMFASAVLVATTRAPPPKQLMRTISEMSLMSSRTASFEGPSSPHGILPEVYDVAADMQVDLSIDGDMETSSNGASEVSRQDTLASESQQPAVDDDQQSLASFIATEFAATKLEASMVRKRTTAAGAAEEVAPPPVVFGVMGAVASAGF